MKLFYPSEQDYEDLEDYIVGEDEDDIEEEIYIRLGELRVPFDRSTGTNIDPHFWWSIGPAGSLAGQRDYYSCHNYPVEML